METNTVVTQQIAGPAANESDWRRFMNIDLSKIAFDVKEIKKKHGVSKAVSREDRFQMGSL